MPRRENLERKPRIFKLDCSEGWDTESQVQLFLAGLKRLGLYRADALYCGFNAGHIGVQHRSKENPTKVYCSKEEDLFYAYDSMVGESAWHYAQQFDQPAIAIYDPSKMSKTPNTEYEYEPTDSTALIAIIKIKLDEPL